MAQDIQSFYTQVKANDFARQFQFRITSLANTVFNGAEQEFLYLETGNLPGRSITNVQVPFMGLQFNVPGTATYPGSDSWAVTFRCDQNYNIRGVLENATFITFDDGASTGNYQIPRDSSQIVLELLGKNMAPVRTYTLYGAYVVSVGDMAYNLGDGGTIVTVPATLAYQYWRASTPENTWSTTALDEPVDSTNSNDYADQSRL